MKSSCSTIACGWTAWIFSVSETIKLLRSTKTASLFILLLSGLTVSAQLNHDGNGIIYVKSGASGNGSGWDNATGSLHEAIHASGVTKVFVAIGNYDVPSPNSFVMKNGVEIYGGFDPANGIQNLNDQRILPNHGTAQGSVLNGKNERPVIWNHSNGVTPSAILDGFTITGGYSATNGGGIYNTGTSPTLRNLLITGNSAGNGAAGIYCNDASPVVTDVVVKGNTGTNYGGGVASANASSPVFTNVLITGNTAGTDGGGWFHAGSGLPVLVNVTVAANTPNALTQSALGLFSLSNSIVYGGISGAHTAQYSLIEGNTSFSSGNPDPANIGLDDLFTDPGNGNFTLSGNSPGINAGNNTVFAGLTQNTRDLAGNARVFNYTKGGIIDLGAYERLINVMPDAGGTVYITTTGSGRNNGTSWSNASTDLHNAIHADGVQKVFVAKGTYPVGEHSFVMKNGVAIYGGFDPANGITDLAHPRILPNKGAEEGTVLDGENVRPVFYNNFTSSTALNSTAVLDGFTITKGYAPFGAGMYNNHASPVLNDVNFIENHSLDAGGGMYNIAGSPSLTNVIFANNSTQYSGGGIYINSNASCVLNNVLFTANSAGQHGGAIINGESSSLILNNVTMVGNGATQSGGAIYNIPGGSIALRNSIIFGNTANVVSPNIFTSEDALNKENCLLEGFSDTGNGNLNAAGIVLADIFTDPVNSDFTLKSTGPAINKGSNAHFPGLDATTKDLAGNPRWSGAFIDLGPYEHQLPLTPDANGIMYVRAERTGGGTGTDWENATADLQGAINANDVQKVFVAVGNYNVPAPNSFVMKEGVAIHGGFDPDHNIQTLADNRILMDPSGTTGSILNGRNERPVVWNSNNGLTSAALLDGFTITNGLGSTGAGIYNQQVSPSFSNLIVRGNGSFTSFSKGGGMYNAASNPTLFNVIFSSNKAIEGGGIYNAGSDPKLTQVSITGNTGWNHGGGIYNNQSYMTLNSTLIAGNNSVGEGGGLYLDGGNEHQNYLVMHNVTFANNTPDAARLGGHIYLNNSILYGTTNYPHYTAKHSLVQGNSNTTNGNLNATGITPDVIFIDPAAGNYTLKPGTPVVDAGDNTLYAGLDAGTKDLAGSPRVHNYASGGIIDIGAYEYAQAPDVNGIVYVKSSATGTGNGSSWTNATADLHNAIQADGVQKVFVAKGEYKVGDHSFIMKNNVAIYGGFDPDHDIKTLTDSRIMPDASGTVGSVLNGQDARPVFWNDFASLPALDRTAILNGFTVRNGNGDLGGGFYNYNASPSLSNLVIMNNKAFTFGGGIYNENSSPLLTNVIMKGNSAYVGGAVYLRSGSSPVLKNVQITDNTGSGLYGGIYDNAESNTLTLHNVTIAGNTQGGLLAFGALYMKNSIVYGGISHDVHTIEYSLVEGETSTADHNIDATDITPAHIFNNPVAGDYTLLPCSPVTNAGTPDTTGLGLPSLDLAGQPRIFADRVDMGAYENHNTPVAPGLSANAGEIVRIQSASGSTGYYDPCNQLLARVTTSGVSDNIGGVTTASVWTETNQPVGFVKRHYQITPDHNAANATGNVTLYFLNEDFKAFNTQVPAPPFLLPDADEPTTIAERKSNLKIEKRGGISSNNTGLPFSYTGDTETLVPDDEHIVWNATDNRWEITFAVTGFSGFFVKATNAPLPVRIAGFTGRLADDQSVKLEWAVAEQVDIARYQVEYSPDGRNFTAIGTVAANRLAETTYHYTDSRPLSGSVAYYRLRIEELDGSLEQTRIIAIKLPGEEAPVVYPVPARDVVWLKGGIPGEELKLRDINGRLLRTAVIQTAEERIDVSQLPAGIYFLYSGARTLKIVKQ